MCSFHWDNSQTFLLGFQYKVLHILTEIKHGIDSVANLLKVTILHSFRVMQFGRCLTDKTTERSIVTLHIFLLKLNLKQV